MHLGISEGSRRYLFGRLVLTGLAWVSAWLVILSGFSPTINAASPVVYSINPVARAVQSANGIEIDLSINTEVAIAGASVHLTYTNSSYVSLHSADSPAISFIDYHTAQNDIVFICNNNNCAPGTYQIARITVKAGQSGTARVTFEPKETADTQLNLIEADGATGSYVINSTAAASPIASGSGNLFTIPQDNGNGGMQPLRITNDQYLEQVQNAQDTNDATAAANRQSFWTPLNVLLIGLGIGIGLAVSLFVLIKLFGVTGGGGPSGKSPPPGTIIYSG